MNKLSAVVMMISVVAGIIDYSTINSQANAITHQIYACASAMMMIG